MPIFVPNLNIGRLQDGSLCDRVPGSCLDIDVRGMVTSGSVNIVAVASTVLGIRNPD